ncbi:MAG: N(4)-(beta-N-acetylglucosaminyl)-L-asparaginase [Candidatus Aminicenantes bacterium]|nr:N(4)-(beta-N-acetylglucosaminyl)-L-asparaginase [Candidatus Aminicenantes bacterium]
MGVGFGAGALFSGMSLKAGGHKNDGFENGMRIIASGNGIRATEKAMDLLRDGADPLEAVISGVNIVENDPQDHSVGFGGLPNELGVVELDASVMYGPTHNGGAVASLQNIKNPSRVARLVMERTDHALLVGEGALQFALAHGFKKENLLTDEARKIWLKKKEQLTDDDFWFPPKSDNLEDEIRSFVETHGTINCLAINEKGDLAGVTTTSGFFFKIPGRVGDSPIIGAGLYVDNEVGAAGSTGRGEANILNCGSYSVVEFMRQGFGPEEACLRTLKRIAEKSRLQPRLIDEEGKARFQLNFYALNRKGEFGAAAMWSGANFAVHDGKVNKMHPSAYLFKDNNTK